ncbi:MAG: DUF2012 domain-containing protein [Chloroflexi bacterium]|nr:DUF2012 domain-containing protein [Chloroflexota bacterium]
MKGLLRVLLPVGIFALSLALLPYLGLPYRPLEVTAAQLNQYGSATSTSTRTPTLPPPTLTRTPTSSTTSIPSTTATPSLTPTPTATPVPGRVMGFVSLEGHAGVTRAGVTVRLDQAQQVVTGADGSFIFDNVPAGAHDLRAETPGYLCLQRSLVVNPGQTVDLGTVSLKAGDANGDNRVDLLDLVLIGAHYGENPLSDARADMNGDGVVNLFDLVLVGNNFGLSCPQG